MTMILPEIGAIAILIRPTAEFRIHTFVNIGYKSRDRPSDAGACFRRYDNVESPTPQTATFTEIEIRYHQYPIHTMPQYWLS